MPGRKKVYLRVPCYIAYDAEEADENEEGDVMEELPDIDALIDDLQERLSVTFDHEGGGNPLGFCSADVRYDEAVEVKESEWEDGGVIPCRDGQLVRLVLHDFQGTVVRDWGEVDVNEAGDEARRFLILHGGDPDEGGRGVQSGSIRFIPRKKS